jgi:hypothetical protein
METLNKKLSVKVVLIDSGISIMAKNVLKNVKYETGFVLNDNHEIKMSNYKVESIHGTAIALIMTQICPNIEIYSIKILDSNLNSSGPQLKAALNLALKIKPHIINLSLGTTNPSYKKYLKKIIKRAKKNNTVIVCAKNNYDIKSYPSCLKEVIVVAGKDYESKNYLSYHENMFFAPFKLIDIKHSSIMGNKSLFGNSFAAAYITGHIANLINECNTSNLKSVKEILINRIGCGIYV